MSDRSLFILKYLQRLVLALAFVSTASLFAIGQHPDTVVVGRALPKGRASAVPDTPNT